MTQDHGQVAPQQRLIAGRYAFISEIGRGGMGIVWLAEDRMIGRRVAIKELHLPEGVPVGERGVFEERVLREARTAGRLNDPAVVTVYDVLQEAGNTYIVMELIEAPTLSDIVRQRGPLPQEAVAALAGQLLSALEAAHAAGVVHRDVKPSNIMVLPSGRVKLTDFGIAQSLDDPRLTTSGVLIGSPTYMAPERIKGGEADAASDLWSLGAVLFMAVEGHAPFERATTAATMHAIMNEVPFLTRSHGPLASVIMGLLINAPQARLNAQQVRGLLAQVTTGPPTGQQTGLTAPRTTVFPHQPDTALLAGRPTGRRRRILAIALSVIIAAALFAGGYLTGQLFASRQSTDAAMSPTLTYGPGGDIKVFELSGGSDGYCLSGPLASGRSYPTSAGVECAEPHDLEVFDSRVTRAQPAEYEKKLDLNYPGAAPLARYAEAWCSLSFASNLVAPQDKNSTLSYAALVPTRQQWESGSGNDKADRSTYCVLFKRGGGQLEGSKIAGPP